MEPKEKTVQLRYFIAECYYCKVPCVVQCGHCCSALTYLGQKHNCPDPDKGFLMTMILTFRYVVSVIKNMSVLTNFRK